MIAPVRESRRRGQGSKGALICKRGMAADFVAFGRQAGGNGQGRGRWQASDEVRLRGGP